MREAGWAHGSTVNTLSATVGVVENSGRSISGALLALPSFLHQDSKSVFFDLGGGAFAGFGEVGVRIVDHALCSIILIGLDPA
jgi:hypothetical protein